MASFTKEQASAISYTIRTLRPGWNHGAVMRILEGFALENRPVDLVVTACFRAAQDAKAQAPTAITWEQFWAKAGGKSDDGTRMCSECLRRKPLGHMASTQPPFICRECHEG